MTRKAIVTGASRGLGAALVQQLTDDGWEVLEISRTTGERVDLSSAQAVYVWLASGKLEAFLAEASEILLINNAGTISPIGTSGTLVATEIEAAVHLNVTAPLVLTDAVLAARPSGVPTRVVHIASGAGRRPVAGWAVYCATKAALDSHAQALAAEELPGVRVVSVAPGVVNTDMQARIRAADFPLRDRFRAMNDDGVLSDPVDAAAAILKIIVRDDSGVVADVRD